MLPITHILFPVDFSERCASSAPFVNAMANRFGAAVTLFSVTPPMVYVGGMGEPIPMPPDDELLKSGLQNRLDSAFLEEFSGVVVKRRVEVGDAAHAIVRFAHEEKVSLIMMPTHGYGPFRRLLLGSVTAKVLHDAHCPVWTGAHMEEPPALDHLACRNIVCAVDTQPKSAAVMKWAAQYAKDTGAVLRLVHAISGIEAWPERQLDREFEEAIRADARQAIEKMQKETGVDAPLCVAVGDVASAIREEARRHHADLVAIGRGVLHETLGRLRTHSYSIIRQAPCPVISV